MTQTLDGILTAFRNARFHARHFLTAICSGTLAHAIPDTRFPRYAEVQPLAVTLEPGDLLFVPKHWWHFVEAPETSLSVNVWIDAPDDAQDRAKESVARVLVTSLSSGLDKEVI